LVKLYTAGNIAGKGLIAGVSALSVCVVGALSECELQVTSGGDNSGNVHRQWCDGLLYHFHPWCGQEWINCGSKWL